MSLLISGDLRSRLDLKSALAEELTTTAGTPDLLPVAVSDRAATSDAEPWLESLMAEISVGARIEQAPTIAATKWRLGRRPAAAVPLPDRVLFRALTTLLDRRLAPARKPEDFASFIAAPLKEGSPTGFVVLTDIAHYYATLDLDLLGRELIERTGEWEVTRAIVALLKGLTPRVGGLPQGSRTSDRLGDTYAETLHHRLVRRGIECWRFADDFRIRVPNYSAAVRALDDLDEESRRMGLFVNERKTRILTVERYSEMQSARASAFSDAWAEKREELTVTNPYDTSMIEPDEAEVLSGVALDELAAWSSRLDEFKRNPGMEATARIDLALVISILASSKSEEGLEHVPALLRVEPQHTPLVSRYLSDMLAEGEEQAWLAAVGAIGVDSLTEWQKLWLLDALSFDVPPQDYPWEPAEELRAWTKTQLAARNEVCRLQAVWANARQGQLTREEWAEEAQGVSRFGSPTLAAASALVPDLPAAARFTSRTAVAVHDWAQNQHVAH